MTAGPCTQDVRRAGVGEKCAHGSLDGGGCVGTKQACVSIRLCRFWLVAATT